MVPADYVATLKPIARRQVAVAGYRLADELIVDQFIDAKVAHSLE